jgi:hypothetical protein
LRRQREAFLGTRIDSLLTHDVDRPRLVARPEDEERCAQAFLRCLLKEEKGWTLLRLFEQEGTSGMWPLPQAVSTRGFRVRSFAGNPNSTVPLKGRGLRDFLATMPKSDRHPAQRKTRRLFEAGRLTAAGSADRRSCAALFDLYLEMEQKSWKAEIGGIVGRDPRRVAFFRNLIDGTTPLQMAVDLLMLDDVVIAGGVYGVADSVTYFWEIGYDEDYRELSPGAAMMLLSIGRAYERGTTALNMFGNYAYYKERWQADVTETVHVQIIRRPSIRHLRAIAGELRRALRPPVTQRETARNLEKPAAVDEPAPARPDRERERRHAQEVLQALRGGGARMREMSTDELRDFLGIAAAKKTPTA